MINIFYLYAVVEILNIIYYLRSYLRDYKKNPNREDEFIDITNPIDTLSKIDKFGFIMSALSFIWCIIGLFTNYKFYFITLLVITFSFALLKSELKPKIARNIFVINSILKILIILLIIYGNIH